MLSFVSVVSTSFIVGAAVVVGAAVPRFVSEPPASQIASVQHRFWRRPPGLRNEHRSSLLEVAAHDDHCHKNEDMTFCSFDQLFGTGLCPSNSFMAVRNALLLGEMPVGALRRIAPLAQMPLTSYPSKSQWASLDAVDADAQHPGKIYIVDNFLSQQQLEAFKRLAAEDAAHKKSADTPTLLAGPNPHCEFRKSHHWDVDLHSEMPELVQKITHVTGTLLEQLESVQLTKYGPGDFYSDHYDQEPCDQQIHSRIGVSHLEAPQSCGDSSRRAVTLLVYLNDEFEGGATNFPRLGKRILPKAGRAVIFHPTAPDGRTDPFMVHSSEETIRGHKYVLQQWVRHR